MWCYSLQVCRKIINKGMLHPHTVMTGKYNGWWWEGQDKKREKEELAANIILLFGCPVDNGGDGVVVLHSYLLHFNWSRSIIIPSTLTLFDFVFRISFYQNGAATRPERCIGGSLKIRRRPRVLSPSAPGGISSHGIFTGVKPRLHNAYRIVREARINRENGGIYWEYNWEDEWRENAGKIFKDNNGNQSTMM